MVRCFMKTVRTLCMAALCLGAAAMAEDWPVWRGENADARVGTRVPRQDVRGCVARAVVDRDALPAAQALATDALEARLEGLCIHD